LIISGGRNDREKKVFADIFLLTLDTLIWVNVKVHGDGMIGRAGHEMISENDFEFVIFGGIDHDYHLSNRVTFLTFA